MLASPPLLKSDWKSPRRGALRQQPDSLDSVDSCYSVSSNSSSSQFQPSSSSSSAAARRFRFHARSPPAGSGVAQTTNAPRFDSLESSPTGDREGGLDEKPMFTSRGTFNPEKAKQKLKGGKNTTLRHSRDSDGHRRDPPDIPQQLVLYGSNEFMV